MSFSKHSSLSGSSGSPEWVVLLDEKNKEIGMVPKSEVHGASTPRHRAFSCFLFNSSGQVLLQQRAAHKKTWPSIWSNSCCGHPLPGEQMEEAVRRRILYELGISSVDLQEVLPDYSYSAMYQGVMENEHCPVWVGKISAPPSPNPEEVQAVHWEDWDDFSVGKMTIPEISYTDLSPWCQEEVSLLLKCSSDWQKRVFSCKTPTL